MVSILGKRPVFYPYTHIYLRSLAVDLAVSYSLQISHCVLPFFVHVQYKTSLDIQGDTLHTLCNSYFSSEIK